MGSYAYHLPLNDKNDRMSFGLSLGYMDEMVDQGKMGGDADDPSTRNFNQRQQCRRDFGVAYTSDKLNLQVAIPNLRNSLGYSKEGEQVVNELRFFAAASYKVRLSERDGMAAGFNGISTRKRKKLFYFLKKFRLTPDFQIVA